MADHGGVWPAGQLLSDGGKVWRNITSVPLTTPPSGFPRHAEPVEGYVGPWSATADYAVGDVVDRGGRYYRCLTAHGAAHQGTWGPPATGVWEDLGPA